jgi:hypothetical protein
MSDGRLTVAVSAESARTALTAAIAMYEEALQQAQAKIAMLEKALAGAISAKEDVKRGAKPDANAGP